MPILRVASLKLDSNPLATLPTVTSSTERARHQRQGSNVPNIVSANGSIFFLLFVPTLVDLTLLDDTGRRMGKNDVKGKGFCFELIRRKFGLE